MGFCFSLLIEPNPPSISLLLGTSRVPIPALQDVDSFFLLKLAIHPGDRGAVPRVGTVTASRLHSSVNIRSHVWSEEHRLCAHPCCPLIEAVVSVIFFDIMECMIAWENGFSRYF